MELRRKNLLWTSLVALMLTIAVLAGTTTVTSTGMPTVSVDPPLVGGLGVGNIENPPNSTFSVNITVAHIIAQESLYGWDFYLTFNPGLLNVTNVTRGGFLGQAGLTEWEDGTLEPAWNNDFGYVSAGDMLVDLTGDGASGSGVLATIEFNVTGWGVCALDLGEAKEDTKLYTVKGTPPDQYIDEINHKSESGLFDNREENDPPTASFNVEHPGMVMPVVGQPITFDSNSSDEDGWIVSYAWDFGEHPSATASGMIVDHAFAKVGTYTVSLTVTDNDGATDTATTTVNVVEWMEGGDVVDLLKARPEHHEWNEVAKGRDLKLLGLVGNPTNDTYFEAYVEFEIFGKLEGAKLGKVTTNSDVVPPGEELELEGIMDLRETTWRLLRPPVGWSFNARLSVCHRYEIFATCYYRPVSSGDYEKGFTTKVFGLKVIGAKHDIRVLEVTTNATDGVPSGDPVEIYVTIDNQGGNYDEYFNITVTCQGLTGTWPVEERPTMLGHQETKIETFILDTNILPGEGRYRILVELDRLSFEEDITDNGGHCDIMVVP